MGSGYCIGCDSCGYRDSYGLGQGMLSEVNGYLYLQEAAAGKLGKTMQQLVEKYPEGKMDTDRSLYICKCGNLTADTYIVFSYRDGEKEHHRSIAKKCPECHRNMKRYSVYRVTEGDMFCPKCGGKLFVEMTPLMWD